MEDANGDGKFDKSTIFADELAWPTAIFFWAGGVLVADAPDILYLKDTTGDGVADERRVVYTGLGTSNVQGLINSFQWGLDNRIYAAISSSGAELKFADSGADAKPLAVRGRDIAIDPRTWAVTPVSGGAQHGLSMNDWGDRFSSSNSDHLQQVMYEDRYLARNPYLAAPAPRRSIAADGPQADVFRTSPVEPWRIVRTRLRMQKIVPGIVEGGGRPAGYFTGATGATIYRGDAWPARMGGPGHCRRRGKQPRPSQTAGAGRASASSAGGSTRKRSSFRPATSGSARCSSPTPPTARCTSSTCTAR